MSVAHSAFRGAAWTVLTSVGSRGVSLVGTFILTHFLNPEIVGEVNVAFVAVLTASFLSHIGFGHYVVTRHDAGPAGVFHAAVLHLVLGAVAFGVVIAIAGPLGPILNAPAMASYVPGLALAFMLERISIMPQRICVRELRFRLTSITSSSAEVLFTVTTISLAAAGWGGHAIVWANVVRFGLLAVVYVTVVGRREWLQPVPLSAERMKDVLRFGGPLWIGGVAHIGSRRWDNLLFGYLFGPGAVGLYNQAYNLADVPATVVGEQIGDVLLPSYAHMTGQERKDALVQFTALLALVIFPLAVGLGAIAPSVIVLLGDEWDGVAPMLMVLSALSVARPVGWTISSYLTARGRTQAVMSLELINVTVLLAAVGIFGLVGGPVWACAGAGVSFTFMGVIGVWMVKRLDGIEMGRVLWGMLPPLLATLPMAAAVVGVHWVLSGRHAAWSLVAELATGVAVYVPSALIIAPRTSRDFLRMFREAILKR